MPYKRLPEVLGDYARRKAARFHMPGHKGRGMGAFFNEELVGWDVTELSFSDDLHDPRGAISEAQQAFAARYGAQESFFLVNGATAGLHALMLSLPPGSRLLVSRDCHRAVLNGAALAGHTVSFLMPERIPAEDLWGCVSAEALEQALAAPPAEALPAEALPLAASSGPVSAVCVTSPNYYGLCADIPALAAVAHRHGALLFVDAAHGAHFPFSDRLPAGPARPVGSEEQGEGADAWVNSAHKTLNALGQAALLHIGPRMRAPDVRRALSMVQTSSPSYLLLASLDWARYTAELDDAWGACAARCGALAKRAGRALGVYALPASIIGQAGVAEMDPTRLVLDISGRGITGYAACRALEQQNVYVEMADSRRLVLICTPSDAEEWDAMLLGALQRLPYAPAQPPEESAYPQPVAAMPLREAALRPAEQCPLALAAGRVAAEAFGVYPPGIPLCAPGEAITGACVELAAAQLALGASLFGARGGCVTVVKE